MTALQARTFAIWTLTSAVVRAYAAYNINEKQYVLSRFTPWPMSVQTFILFLSVYDMAFFTYLIAFGHFSSEFFIFRSVTVNPGSMSPVIVSSKPSFWLLSSLTYRLTSALSLVWMFTQYEFYVKS